MAKRTISAMKPANPFGVLDNLGLGQGQESAAKVEVNAFTNAFTSEHWVPLIKRRPAYL